MIVDAHSHMIPGEVLEFAAAKGLLGLETEADAAGKPIEWVVHREGYRYPLWPSFRDVPDKLAELRRMRVDKAIVSIAPPFFFYHLDRSDGTETSRRTNEGIARLVSESEGALAGMATLPMQDVASAVAELERAVTELKLVGAEIGPSVGSIPLDDARYIPLFEAAESLSVPLFIHPYYTGTKPGMEDYYLTNVVANPLDTTVCLFRLAYAGVFERFPDLKILAAHGGGFAPYQYGRANWAHRVREECRTGFAPPGEQLQNVYFDTLVFSTPALQYLVDWASPGNVVLGTDAPFDMGDLDSRAFVEGAELTAEQTVAVLGANASRLFEWPAST